MKVRFQKIIICHKILNSFYYNLRFILMTLLIGKNPLKNKLKNKNLILNQKNKI